MKPFASAEFASFILNGVKHIRYHPASNGLAERKVRKAKEGDRRIVAESYCLCVVCIQNYST